MDEEAAALSYIMECLDDFVFPLKDLMSEFDHAPPPVSEYLTQYCGDLKQFEQYLHRHESNFFLENGKVMVFDSELKAASTKAVRYFEEKLNLCGKPYNYMDFKGFLNQAEADVQDFIRCFYPAEEFKQFLLAHPAVFVLFEDDTVFLIENEAVNYFEQCVESDKGIHYMKLRGCVSQAPKHVITFVNDYYPQEHFLQFLENNSDVFHIVEEHVYLTDD